MKPGTQMDGDAQFNGVNELLPPGVLAPGELAYARNNRCRYGKAEPRLGCLKVPWSNLVTSGASSKPIPYGTVYGRGYFQDSDGVVWAIIAADGKVFKFREGNGSSEIALPSGISIESAVSFTQTYNGLMLFRGLGLDTLLMATLDTGFITATMASNTISGALTENESDGTVVTPQADRGEWINGRLFVPTETATEKDLVNISDYLNGTRFATVRSQARINQGASDRLTRILKFGRSEAAIAFKTQSIYGLYGISGALSSMSQDEITREFGLLSPRACINVGKGEADQPDEVWFMGSTGSIYKITPDSGSGLLGVSSLPVSEEIAQTIARINRNVAASTATFEVWDDKLYAAVPLDGAQAEGPELLRDQSYDSGGIYEFPIIPGATYQWTKGANDYNIGDGIGGTAYDETAIFEATSNLAQLNGVESVPVTASLKRVFVGVNNAVLVYDFIKQKWAGTDDGISMAVQEWLKLKVGGEEKLFFISADGFVNYSEALFDDENAYETLGANLHNTGVYGGGGSSTSTALQPGLRYAYATTAAETSVVNGSLTIPGGVGAGTFVATTASITSYGAPAATIGFVCRLIDWTTEYAGVDHEWLTRAYRGGSQDRKRFSWVSLNVRTFDPDYAFTAKVEGVAEEFTLEASVTKDNTAYLKPAGTAAWVSTNYNDDHGNPYREDYHVDLSDDISNGSDIVEGQRYYVDSEDAYTAATILYNGIPYNRGETFLGVAGVATWSGTSGDPVVYPPGSYILPNEGGVVLDLHQETEENFRVAQRGREIQFRGRNTQGRCELISVAAEMFSADQRRERVEA